LKGIDTKQAKRTLINTIMHPPPVITAKDSESIFTISNLMKEKEVSSIIISDQNENSVGIITERDIVRRVIADSKDPNITKAKEIKSQPLITVDSDDNLFDAVMIMEKNNIRRLPVVKDNSLVGFLTITDIIRHFHTLYKEDQDLFKFMVRYKKYFEE
jgi:signal-transduction protein with cAMP-binding, CBS, and nucleotidyltransferase domain